MTRFAYGDNDADLSDYAWYCENSDKQTHPVGQKKPNAFGLYDMHGNVCEWCADELAGSYTDATSVDPFGRGADFIRVLRGGSWRSEPKDCRSASRGRKRWYVDLYNTNGLRVVVNAVGLE
jgi:formylglycine-generating enzyme required for sulfatase activity